MTQVPMNACMYVHLCSMYVCNTTYVCSLGMGIIWIYAHTYIRTYIRTECMKNCTVPEDVSEIPAPMYIPHPQFGSI